MENEAGFTLLEMICVLAIIALLAGLFFPAIPMGTSRARLEGYAMGIAALLEGDRGAAIRNQRQVATALNSRTHTVQSGANGSAVHLPSDVAFDAILAKRCANRPTGMTIDFFPTGMSCGGTITLLRQGVGFQIRVNWLTGGIEIVESQS